MNINLTPSVSEQTVEYAGFWKRLIAFIIDTLLLHLVFSILLMFSVLQTIGEVPHHQRVMSPEMSFANTTNLILITAHFVVYWLYFSIMESSSWQATLGKHFLGIKVTDLQGNRISFGQATTRYFAKILSGILLFVGYFMIGFTEKKQGLHDIIANTLVIKD